MTRLALPILRPVDGNGNPFPSGTLNFYDAGASTTPKTVYSDSALSVSLGAVVTADGEGLFTDVYYSGDIRFVLKDKNGVIQSTKDIYGAGNIDTADIVDLAVTTGKIDDNAVTLGKLFVLDNAKIITSNGVANSQVSLSGDATMTNTGVLTVANTAISAAKLATDAVETAKIKDLNVTEGKLSAAVQTKLNKVYSGSIDNSGSVSWSGTAVSGWSISRTAAGIVKITHSFATTDYVVTATCRESAGVAAVADVYTVDANYFEVRTQLTNSISDSDRNFSFIVVKNA